MTRYIATSAQLHAHLGSFMSSLQSFHPLCLAIRYIFLSFFLLHAGALRLRCLQDAKSSWSQGRGQKYCHRIRVVMQQENLNEDENERQRKIYLWGKDHTMSALG